MQDDEVLASYAAEVARQMERGKMDTLAAINIVVCGDTGLTPFEQEELTERLKDHFDGKVSEQTAFNFYPIRSQKVA